MNTEYQQNYDFIKQFCDKIIKVIMSHPAGWEALVENTRVVNMNENGNASRAKAQ